MAARAPTPPLSAAQFAEALEWVEAEREKLPAPLVALVAQFEALVAALGQSERKARSTLASLARALGAASKSERRPSRRPGDPGLPPRDPRATLTARIERTDHLSAWHLELALRNEEKKNRLVTKLEKLPKDAESEARAAEARAAEAKRRRQQFVLDLESGGGPDPALARSDEALMTGPQVTISEQDVFLAAPAAEEGETEIECLVETRERYDFKVLVGKVYADVEKRVVVDANGVRRIRSASTHELGPPRFSVTWPFLVNLTIMVAQYAMPMHRLGRLLSTDEKQFSASSLSRMLRYVAERLAPIYLELFDQLAEAEILAGDDTPARVLEVKRYFASPEPREPPPWHTYRTRQDAAETAALLEQPSLEHELARELGFESARRDGSGSKRALNTTIVSGRSDPSDPRSLINFYRTHLGGFGNLVETLLEKRTSGPREVVIQGDLATVNLVTNPELLSRFTIRYAGCAAHARRPFALYENDDPEHCGVLLKLFQAIALHEETLTLQGRNPLNVIAVRQNHSRPFWDSIRDWCGYVCERWSSQTKLGDGARYVLRHFDKLTAYLDDPRIDPTNNFRERLLRPEKVIEKGSMFRATLSGRFVLDILRTILQTAVAAGVPLQEYLLDLLTTDPADIAERPANYTPRTWFARITNDTEADEDNATQRSPHTTDPSGACPPSAPDDPA